MFYNHNPNLNKWFVSPYLTISKRQAFFFLDKMVMIMKRTSIKNFFKKSKKKKKSNGVEYKMSWSMTKPTKSHVYSKDWSACSCAA